MTSDVLLVGNDRTLALTRAQPANQGSSTAWSLSPGIGSRNQSETVTALTQCAADTQ
jgi:hypothetical protein